MRPIWNGYFCARKRLFFHRIGSKPLLAAVGLRVRFGPVAYHRLVGIALSKPGTAFGTALKR